MLSGAFILTVRLTRAGVAAIVWCSVLVSRGVCLLLVIGGLRIVTWIARVVIRVRCNCRGVRSGRLIVMWLLFRRLFEALFCFRCPDGGADVGLTVPSAAVGAAVGVTNGAAGVGMSTIHFVSPVAGVTLAVVNVMNIIGSSAGLRLLVHVHCCESIGW